MRKLLYSSYFKIKQRRISTYGNVFIRSSKRILTNQLSIIYCGNKKLLPACLVKVTGYFGIGNCPNSKLPKLY